MRSSWLVCLSCLALAACGPSSMVAPDSNGGADAAADALDDLTSPVDAGPPDTAPADAPPVDAGPVFVRCEETEPDGVPMLGAAASTLVGTIEPTGTRLTMATARSAVFEDVETTVRGMGLMGLRRGAAQARVRRTDLGGPASAPTGERRSIAYFVHFSDTQLVDDESPARLANLDNPSSSGAIRPQEAYLPFAMSAMHRTLAALERPERPYQFGIVAGDCADTGQLNELQWFMKVMNGERVHLDSGNDDDPLPGLDNDPKDPFTPTVFPAPWYYVPGNHDVLVVGIAMPTEIQQRQAIGANAPNGTRDYTRRWGAPRGGRVVADMNRRLVTRSDIVRELRTGPAMPGPEGHGFSATPDLTLGAHYVSDVIPGLLRVLAVDTSDESGGSQGLVKRAVIDRWLRPELERAQRDGVLVMLTSHHPTSSIDRRAAEVGTEIADAVEPGEIERLVAGYPNVIAWLAGHEHLVKVRSIRGADATHPGYWEIQSGSIADWPNQSRIVELVNNGDGTLSIFGTLIDYEATSCFERRFRRLALADMLSGWEHDLSGTANDRNVELVIPIPESARAAVERASMGAPTRLESETTLRGMR